MKRFIQFSDADELKALPILLRHSPGMILPNRTYVLEDAAVQAIHDAGIGADLGDELFAGRDVAEETADDLARPSAGTKE